MARSLTLAGLLLATSASALPADARLTLTPGTEKFLRAPIEVIDVVTEPEGIVTAEVMPSGEIFVTVPAKAKGATTLFAIGQDLLFAWDLCISGCPPETSITQAKAACADLKQVTEDGKAFWT